MTLRNASNEGASWRRRSSGCWAILIALGMHGSLHAQTQPPAPPASAPKASADGTIETQPFSLPFTYFASPEARAEWIRQTNSPPMTMSGDIAAMRRATDVASERLRKEAKARYRYTSAKSVMGGVKVEEFVPVEGVSPENRDRVLINLHGGGFMVGGGGVLGAAESIPIASVARIKVVAVDYRQGPEHPFPAASEDVAAVYRELLKRYKPQNIGIYGCSAGGMLSGQSIPWFLQEKLPLPGAIGIFCASTHSFAEGDSAQLWPALISGQAAARNNGQPSFGPSVYFSTAKVTDPRAIPAADKAVLRAFPPTLFVAGTRAMEMSAAAQSHLELRELGVTSELLLFDGMSHGFVVDASLPEARRAYTLIARFFRENLGKTRSGEGRK